MLNKYCRLGQALDENMAHAHCMLDTQCYKYTHTVRLFNTHRFSTTTMVARTRLYVTLLHIGQVLCKSEFTISVPTHTGLSFLL